MTITCGPCRHSQGERACIIVQCSRVISECVRVRVRGVSEGGPVGHQHRSEAAKRLMSRLCQPHVTQFTTAETRIVTINEPADAEAAHSALEHAASAENLTKSALSVVCASISMM